MWGRQPPPAKLPSASLPTVASLLQDKPGVSLPVVASRLQDKPSAAESGGVGAAAGEVPVAGEREVGVGRKLVGRRRAERRRAWRRGAERRRDGRVRCAAASVAN
jgi:hypothetical protein